MYNYEWDIETGGYILLPTKITGVTKELRPVFYDELHLLGVDRDYGWIIPNAENPLMWAEGRRYFYRGELVAEATGGRPFLCSSIKKMLLATFLLSQWTFTGLLTRMRIFLTA